MNAERCTICNRSYPLQGTVCYPCSNGRITTRNQDQDQDQVIGDDEKRSAPSPMPCPGPGCNGNAPTHARALVVDERDDGPELHRLEEAHRLRQLEPVEVRLGELPPGAGRVMRDIAEHMRLRMGLRLKVGDDRPLPYATSEAVRAGLAKDKPTASNAIRALVRAGVIDYVGALPPSRPGLDGTKLYSPPSQIGGAS